MSRWASFTMQYAKRAVDPFFFEGWGALALLFVAALTITFALSGADVTAEGLFQSPQSPVEVQPTAVPPPAEPPTPIPPAPAEPAATVPPAQPQPELPAEAPVEAPPPAVDAAQPAPVDAGQAAPEGETPPPTPQERRPARNSTTPAGDDPQMVVDQAEFIDTVVVSFAYIWLCCGIVLILVLPLLFLFLHIRGRSKILKEEQY